MDTSTTKIENSFNLWPERVKREQTINKIRQPGIIKVLSNGRVIRGFDTFIPDGRSLNGNDTGSFLISTQQEKA